MRAGEAREPGKERAEDGIIPDRYPLTENPEPDYETRTRRNIEDSDGTLILNLGTLDGGTALTARHARQIGKPCLIVALEAGSTGGVPGLAGPNQIAVSDVAGPRESQRPGCTPRRCAVWKHCCGSGSRASECGAWPIRPGTGAARHGLMESCRRSRRPRIVGALVPVARGLPPVCSILALALPRWRVARSLHRRGAMQKPYNHEFAGTTMPDPVRYTSRAIALKFDNIMIQSY